MLNPQTYITLYESLNSNSHSQKANEELIRMQGSDEAWQIAKQLMLNSKYHLHGCQLLSKKLNRPYTPEMQAKYQLVSFLLSFQQLNKPMVYCLAKLALQLDWDMIHLGERHENIHTLLAVLKAVPEAAAVVSLTARADERRRANKLLDSYKGFLAQVFENYQQDVIECVQSFTANNFKINSEALVRLLLTRPLFEVNEVLQTLLLNEDYPGLYNEVFHFLINSSKENTNLDDFFNVFLAFTQSINLLQLNTQILTGIMEKILTVLKIQNTLPLEQRKNHTYISDSFELWVKISDSITKSLENNALQTNIKVCLEAFVELWKIVVERSIQYQMPKFKSADDNLAISLDSDEDELTITVNVDTNNKFRATAEDMLPLCYRALSLSPLHSAQCLSSLAPLTTSPNALHLELSIYVISCVIDCSGARCIEQVGALIHSITSNSNAKDPYIWQQLIKLLGKLGQDVVADARIMVTSLLVLKQSVAIEELAVLACENFNEILQTCNNSSGKLSHKQILQDFFDYLYNNIYFQTSDPAVFEKLTKSSIIFIYYFRPEKSYLESYLLALNAKIETLASLESKCEIIENLVLSHNYVSSEAARPFTPVISEFCAAFLPVVVGCLTGKGAKIEAKKIGVVLGQLSTVLNAMGGYNTKIWAEAVTIIFGSSHLHAHRASLVSLVNKFITVEVSDAEYAPTVLGFIRMVEPLVTGWLLDSTQNEYKLINKGLTFHLTVLRSFVSGLGAYDPEKVVQFIVGKVLNNFLKFEYESTRTSLGIVRYLIEKGYRVEDLLESVLRVYGRLVDMFWKSLEAIIYESFKAAGPAVYKQVLPKVNPQMNQNNPLYDALLQAIKNSDGVSIKNILSNIK